MLKRGVEDWDLGFLGGVTKRRGEEGRSVGLEGVGIG